jgi:hypothetical protein
MAKKPDQNVAERVNVQDLQSYEIEILNHIKGDNNFNPKDNLRSVCSGVWKYICEDVEKFNPVYFKSVLAKNFGIKENDLIYLVGNQKYKIVVV